VTGAVDWVHDHFAWIRSTEELTVAEILRRADVIGRRRHLDGLIVDPFNEVDRGDSRESETLRISEEITRIRRWARRRQAHVWVVAHPRKLERKASGEYATPTLYDIAHSATFRDKADMGLVVERPRRDPFADTTIHVGKVRFQPQHGREGAAQVTFSSSAQRFTSGGGPL
jgi:twinkle protein